MKTVIVVGAGPAGLAAAHELVKSAAEEWKVIVLEESSFIGGISRTAVCGDCRIDIGGHRFFSKSREVNDLWTQLMPIQGEPSRDDILLGRECHIEPDWLLVYRINNAELELFLFRTGSHSDLF